MSAEQPNQDWDDIEEGDAVDYVVRLGEGLTKRKKAKVYEVCGKGVLKILVGDDRLPRTVRTKDLERPVNGTPKPVRPVPPQMPPLSLVPRPVNPAPAATWVEPAAITTDPTPTLVMPAATIPAPPTRTESSLEAWLRMGEELLAEQELELLILDDEEHNIKSEEAEMHAQIAVLQEGLKKIPARLAGIPERKAAVQAQIDKMKSRLGT